jgi:GNAT superfamily N-acetyltransferase
LSVTEPAHVFSIRPAEAADLPALQDICEEGGLYRVQTVADISVAVDAAGQPVGFIHIEAVHDDARPDANGAYVYPVAVREAWQRLGVGRALMAYARAERGALKLVACKPSQDFYPKAGFAPIGWERIAARIARDCELCAARESCAPIPFGCDARGTT